MLDLSGQNFSAVCGEYFSEMRTDEELMARVAEGDWDALEALLTRVETPLFAFLYRLGCRPDLIEDLVQEVMIRLYESRRRYDPARPFRPWLFGIAVFVWKNARRQRGREEARIEHWAEEAELTASASDPHHRAQALEEAERVRQAVQGLPEAERLPLLLRHYHDLSYAEIQQTLGIPLGTVKTRIHNAVQKVGTVYRRLVSER